MEIIELQNKYTIKIEKKDEYYLTYNYFGRLLFKTQCLSEIDRRMQEYYKSIDEYAERQRREIVKNDR